MRKRALITIVAILTMTGSGVDAASLAKSPEELIQNIVAAAQKGAVEEYIASFTDSAREVVQRVHAKPAPPQSRTDLSRFGTVLTPPTNNTGRINLRLEMDELKKSLSQLKSAEILSKSERADGLTELRVRSSIQTPNGDTLSQEDTLLVKKEDGIWKLAGWSPGVNVYATPQLGPILKVGIPSQRGAAPH